MFWFNRLASCADSFQSEFASHCQCTKLLSVQSGDAELQSENVAKLLALGRAGRGTLANPACNILAAAGAGRQLLRAGRRAGIRTVRSPGPEQLCNTGRPCGSQLAISLRELETARLREPVLMVIVFLMGN